MSIFGKNLISRPALQKHRERRGMQQRPRIPSRKALHGFLVQLQTRCIPLYKPCFGSFQSISCVAILAFGVRFDSFLDGSGNNDSWRHSGEDGGVNELADERSRDPDTTQSLLRPSGIFEIDVDLDAKFSCICGTRSGRSRIHFRMTFPYYPSLRSRFRAVEHVDSWLTMMGVIFLRNILIRFTSTLCCSRDSH